MKQVEVIIFPPHNRPAKECESNRSYTHPTPLYPCKDKAVLSPPWPEQAAGVSELCSVVPLAHQWQFADQQTYWTTVNSESEAYQKIPQVWGEMLIRLSRRTGSYANLLR